MSSLVAKEFEYEGQEIGGTYGETQNSSRDI
jgi:hypothetical protein